ncbi:MAG: hypothetical protein ORN85_07990 [Sediminibacterium sp.]|nr:hypothetical protein [Sediminibacterium sp.]
MKRKVFTLLIKNLSFFSLVISQLITFNSFGADSLQVEIPPNIIWQRGAKEKLHLCINHNCLNENIGYLSLSLLDYKSHQPVDGWFLNFFPNQYFTTIKNTKPCSEFKFEVPHTYKYDTVLMFLVVNLPKRIDSSLTKIQIINKK